jgi:hypothetical protein
MEDITIRKLGWAGHIVSMEDGRIPNKVLNGKFHNTRSVQNPRTRWEDIIQRNTSQILGIREWRIQAEDMEVSSEGGQGPDGAVAKWMDGWMGGWMDGWMDKWMFLDSMWENKKTVNQMVGGVN